MIAPAQMRPVEIIGGGLAGLGLGLGLRRVGVPVVLIEAGTYPRHRVCGEFITSLDQATVDTLGLKSLLTDAREAKSVTWFRGHDSQWVQRLPEPALCLSRHRLDEKMARQFLILGGELQTGKRTDLVAAEGRVQATGRRPSLQSDWLGLKAHFQHLELLDDLELHLGDHAYVGLTKVENDRVNVCGLFRRRGPTKAKTSRQTVLFDQLQRSGLAGLADRLIDAQIDLDSICTVAGLNYSPAADRGHGLHLGDQFGLIPPFTGNGMTVALQSAQFAIAPLHRWSRGLLDWTTAVESVYHVLQRKLAPRIHRAQRLHPWLLCPNRQRWLVRAVRSRLLPVRALYHLLH